MATIHAGNVAVGEYARDDVRGVRWPRAAWGAILMGAITAIACQFVFTVLGIAIGFTVGDAQDSARGIGVGAAAWWLITGTISLLIGGMVLGRVAGIARGGDLHLRALAMWGVVAIFGFFVVWSGMMSAAASPIAGLSVRQVGAVGGTTQGLTGSAAGQTDGSGGTTAGSEPGTATQSAADAAQTASWWTLVGLGAGIAASLGGAWMASGSRDARPARSAMD